MPRLTSDVLQLSSLARNWINDCVNYEQRSFEKAKREMSYQIGLSCENFWEGVVGTGIG